MDAPQPRDFSSIRLVAVASAPGIARALVRFNLNRWGLRTLVGDAELIISELVTNAVEASGSDLAIVRAYISLFGNRARIHVWDRADGKPQPRVPDEGFESGRGLLLVEALSIEWGWYPMSDRIGKVVWADMALPIDASVTVQPSPLRPLYEPLDYVVLTRVRDCIQRLLTLGQRQLNQAQQVQARTSVRCQRIQQVHS
jgi:anti-sigma regulatory factor (Ser/Thr protein kinase)